MKRQSLLARRVGLGLALAAVSALLVVSGQPLGGSAKASLVRPAAEATAAQCDATLWQHVYKPERLIVKQQCITVTGTIVDATANQSTHHADGMRHEEDGDTHGWLKLDKQFENLLNDGNKSDEGGNMVFEVVCKFPVKQADAKPACKGFKSSVTIPKIGSHVAITGSYVQDTNHAQWMEIHPVSSIVVQ